MKNKLYRILPLFLALCLLLSCSKTTGEQGETVSDAAEPFHASGQINMAFVQNDTLSPYEAKTKSNQEISRLMYDGLVRLNDKFEPVYVLASDITADGNN